MIEALPPLVIAALMALGCAGGFVSILFGGSSLIIFPGMLALGFGPIAAIATFAVSIFPPCIVGVLADRAALPQADRRMAWQVGMALLGGVIGAAMLVNTPARAFGWLVPLLLGTATALFAAARRLRLHWAGRDIQGSIGMRLAFLVAYIYGGYFGAGLGIIVVALLAAGGMTDVRGANAIKNLVGMLCAVTSLLVFVAGHHVHWLAAAALAGGGVFGAYAGAKLAARLPAERFRRLIIAVGSVLTLVYTVRYGLS